jgi:hypothetical protein
MIDDQTVLTVERLRDDLVELRKALRQRYHNPSRQVTADDLRARATRCAEAWMVDLGGRQDIRARISSDYLADLNVHFQRLLTYAEHASQRKRYAATIGAILRRFTLDLVIPLKQARSEMSPASAARTPVGKPKSAGMQSDHVGGSFDGSAFVGHSFLSSDKRVAECIVHTLNAIGVSVVTGETPKADRISEKVKKLIEEQHLFVGVFSRRDKIARKTEWTTTSWVVDEKAYAVGKGKRLILLKEEGVGSIGGIQGDYEFIEFNRDRLEELPIRLVQLFEVSATGLKR